MSRGDVCAVQLIIKQRIEAKILHTDQPVIELYIYIINQ